MFDKMFEEEIDAQEGNLEEKFIIESTGIEYTLDELLFESTEGEIILASAEDQMSDYIKTLAEGGLAQEDIKDHIELLVEKYTGIENSAFMKCADIREDIMDLIHDIINKQEESNE